MTEKIKHYKNKPHFKIIIRIALCVIVIIVGYSGMNALANLKQPPEEKMVTERPVQIEVKKIEPENVPVLITGYGEVKTLNNVSLSSEVGGRIIYTHPNLETGVTIEKSEVLFKIDTLDYLNVYEDAKANTTRLENVINRVTKQHVADKNRLKKIERNLELSKTEYERLQLLYTKNSIGTKSGVDRAEQSYNSIADQVEQMNLAVSLFPIQLNEAKSILVSAQAKLDMAASNLNRCEIRAPFSGRVKKVSVEAGQYIPAGFNAVTLADDSVLEIQIPIDSIDANKWLQFETTTTNIKTKNAWFEKLKPEDCHIFWTEADNGTPWTGKLDRVVNFNRQTRTVIVAVRVSSDQAGANSSHSLPLVDGMFCKVEIPGQIMENVYRLPRWAVSFKETVYLAEDNRLKTMAVKVKRFQDEYAFVSEGLSSGDTIIITRLVDPLENTLLQITN